jgi:hypothetical protein
MAGVGKTNGLDAKRVSRLFPQIRHFRLQSSDLKLLNSSFICRLDSQKIPRILGDLGGCHIGFVDSMVKQYRMWAR